MPKDKRNTIKDGEIIKPPDGGYGWMIVLGAALTHIILVGMSRSLGMIYEELRFRYQGSASETAWVAAIFNTCRSLIAPLCGILCKKLSCRTVAILGGLVMCFGLLISAFANSLYYLYVTFAITGFGGAMVFTPAYVMVGNYFDKRKGKAMALATIGSGLGSIILAPTITALLHTYAFFGTMIILGGIQLHNVVAGALYRPLKPPKKVSIVLNLDVENGDEEFKEIQESEPQKGTVSKDNFSDENDSTCDKEKSASQETSLIDNKNIEGKGIFDVVTDGNESKFVNHETSLIDTSTDKKDACHKKLILENSENLITDSKSSSKHCQCAADSLYTNWTFYIYGYLVMSMQVCIQSFLIFLPGYAMEKGVDDTGAALVLSIFGFADMGGRFIFGFLFDLKWIATKRRDFYCLVSGLFGLTAMSLTFIPNYIGICVMSAVVAIFEGATHSQRATVLSDFVPQKQMPSAVGVIIFCQGVGNIWGPPFAGYLRDISGTNAYGFVFCGSVMLSAAILFYLENWMCHTCSAKKKK